MEGHIFAIEAILKHKQVSCIRKNAVYYFQISLYVPEIFKFLKDANKPSNDVIYSTKFDQIWWKRISQPICIRNVWFFGLNATKCAPQFPLISVVTMATYWVPDLPNLKGISGHLWHSIFIFANGAFYTWSNKHLNMFVTDSRRDYRKFRNIK